MDALIIILVLLGTINAYMLFHWAFNHVRVMLGYKMYEYTRILGHGMKVEHAWHKTDELAMKREGSWEFIEVVRPYKKRLKPKQ